MHTLSTIFVLGYHGCDRSTGEALLNGTPFRPSANEYDWLGTGIYFWEANPLRGLEFAKESKVRNKGGPNAIERPFVVGAIIELGFCLDLMTSTGVRAVAAVFEDFARYIEAAGSRMPENTLGPDALKRNLDCAVINHLHAIRNDNNLETFQTVRGVFMEGDRIYGGSGFRHKTHIQICVRDPSCIKGVFRVPTGQLSA